MLKSIGSGGYAEVFRAVARNGDGTELALKRPHDFEEARERMEREIRIQRGLDHPNIMPIVDADDDNQWFVMPLAEGNLEDLLASSRLGADRQAIAVAVLRSIGAGLDAVDRLRAFKLTSSCTITSGDELYEYDDAGNRQRASLNSAQYFRYSSEFGGQLCEQNTSQGSCPTDKTTWQIKYDDAGRTKLWNGWNLSYDGEGRLASACKVSGCATNDMVTMRYDASGKRVELVVRPNGQSATTTHFRYQGNAIAQEVVASTVTRTYIQREMQRSSSLWRWARGREPDP
jgi:hypothetical protein